MFLSSFPNLGIMFLFLFPDLYIVIKVLNFLVFSFLNCLVFSSRFLKADNFW